MQFHSVSHLIQNYIYNENIIYLLPVVGCLLLTYHQNIGKGREVISITNNFKTYFDFVELFESCDSS